MGVLDDLGNWAQGKMKSLSGGSDPDHLSDGLHKNQQGGLTGRKGAIVSSSDVPGGGQANYIYPQELGTPSFPHAVKFYINARSTSAAATQAESANAGALADAQAGYLKDYTEENRAKAEEYENTAALGSAFTAGIGMAAKTAKQSGTSGLMKVVKTGLAAGGGYVAGKILTDNITTVRLLETISLHIPQSIISAYTANWDEASTGVAGLLGTGRGDLDSVLGAGEFLGRGAVSAAANIPKAFGGEMDMGAAFEATSKKVANPYKEQLFKSMGFRQFSFSYTFSPRNQSEAQQIEEIIKLFKYHMHPDRATGDLFLIYPSEFSIEFHTMDDGGEMQQNEHLPRVSSCVLKNCKVTYGPDGMFNTFAQSGGVPSETTMELQFVELETMTADRIAKGF